MPRSHHYAKIAEYRKGLLLSVLSLAAKPLSASQIAKLMAPKDSSMLHWCRKNLPELAKEGILDQIQRPDIIQPYFLYRLKPSTVLEVSKVMEQSQTPAPEDPAPAPKVLQPAPAFSQSLTPPAPKEKPQQLTIPQPQIPAPVRHFPSPGAQSEEASKPMELHALIRNLAGVLELSGFQLKEFSSNENSISITATK